MFWFFNFFEMTDGMWRFTGWYVKIVIGLLCVEVFCVFIDRLMLMLLIFFIIIVPRWATLMRESMWRCEYEKKKEVEERIGKFKCSGKWLSAIFGISDSTYPLQRAYRGCVVYTMCGQRKSVIIDKTNQPKNNYQKKNLMNFLPVFKILPLMPHLYTIFFTFFFPSYY